MWTYVVMVVLFILVIVFFVLKYTIDSKNKQDSAKNILYPFSGYLAPPKQTGASKSSTNPGTGSNPQAGLCLVGQVGGEKSTVPQIQCPTGYKINIVGAFFEVNDPYGECSQTVDQTLQLTCGNQLQNPIINCSVTSTNPFPCGPGMECYNGKCIPMSCTTSADCIQTGSTFNMNSCSANLGKTCTTKTESSTCGSGLRCMVGSGQSTGTCEIYPGAGACMACINSDGTAHTGTSTQGTCAFMPTCMGVQSDGKNKVCNASVDTKNQCRPREATAYLAKHCDGKNICLGTTDYWKPNDSTYNYFGPLPCSLSASDANDTSDYLKLPLISGWGGGPPSNTDPDAKSDPVTLNQGYYVHGLYTCVPDTEIVQTAK